MKVGDLVQMRQTGTLWLVLDIIDDTALVFNANTSYKMWATMQGFEVLNESR